MARIRTQPGSMLLGGSVEGPLISPTYEQPMYVGPDKRCEDNEHGRGKDNPLKIVSLYVEATPLNGVYKDSQGKVQRTYSGLFPDAARTVPTFLVPSPPSSVLVPKVLAKTNPSRPYVDLGTFVGELRDLPGMFRDVWHTARPFYNSYRRAENMGVRQALDAAFKDSARSVFGKTDSHFIATQFGWLPFVGDLEKTFKSGKVIEARYNELQKLRQTGASTRKVQLDSNSTMTIENKATIHSIRGTFKGDLTKAANYRRWGSGKWYLDPNGRLAKADDIGKIAKLARNAVLGLEIDQATAWNLMPWSWMIDWFTNVGDWIDSSRNLVGVNKGPSVCIMTSSVSLHNCVRNPGADNNPEVTGGSFTILREMKERSVHSSSDLPSMTVPILSNRQSMILGALATTRARRL